jgi:hypothetical protein
MTTKTLKHICETPKDDEPLFKCGGKDVTYKRLKEKADELKAQRPEIKIGQIFTVEGKSYVIVKPQTTAQLENANEHDHIVLTLFEI